MSKSNSFTTLYAINVRDKVEKKGGLDYLSWAYAWAELLSNFPDAKRTVYEDPATGWNYFSDGRSAWVKVGITVNGIEHIDYLPIMNHKNYPIDAEKLTSFDVNKTIQRSTAKAIAMHGLGLALWTGEDLTDDADKAVIADKKAKAAPAPALLELNIDDENWDKVMSYVVANKHLGLAKLGQQLIRKYSINPEAKAKIKEAVES
jgi:hypothetical protein